MLGEAAGAGRKIALDQHSARDAMAKPAHGKQVTSFAFVTRRHVTGDHSVIFAGAMERIELTHRAEGPERCFARVLSGRLWARDKSPDCIRWPTCSG